LRERREDILFLAEHFLSWFARKHGCAAQRFSDRCLTTLGAHHWPGNIRELQNVVERAVILAGDSPVLEPVHLCLSAFPDRGPSAAEASTTPTTSTPANDSPLPASFPPLEELEKRHIFAALERCRNNRTQAAKILGISVRTLRNKLNEYHGQNGHGDAALAEDADEKEDSATSG
jgi:DNA-binding NtrC family response regulator